MDCRRYFCSFLLFVSVYVFSVYPVSGDLPGSWELLLQNAGIASMHTAVTHKGTVIFLDRTNNGPSELLFSRCKANGTQNRKLNPSCYAHSALFDPARRKIRPLTILTDTWCSSGQFLPDGTLLQTGGDMEGAWKFRKFTPCKMGQSCEWVEENSTRLLAPRWYATDQILPDGSIIIIGGRGSNNVEFYPPRSTDTYKLPFLSETEDAQMDNLYPYVHLLPNGYLFIFANTRSVVYDYTKNRVIRRLPRLDGGPRNYPSAGSSVMLPLDAVDFSRAEIVICGGAKYGVFLARSTDEPADVSCGRIVVTDENPVWALEDMPMGRIMGDMVLLPTGDVLVVNGAQAGAQGFDMATGPVVFPLLYRPSEPDGLRFMTLAPGRVPRMYHSTANLLPDGRILLAGSNPHYFYTFHVEFPTELRVEAFSPEYLSLDRANLRPEIERIPKKLVHGQSFRVEVSVLLPVVGKIEVNMASAPFATHSFSQGQRLVKVEVSNANPLSDGRYEIDCTAPPSGNIAPPGYYMVFTVNQGVPSIAKWVKVIL